MARKRISYTVEIRRGRDTKTISISCFSDQVLGTVYELHPGYDVIRYY